MFKNIHIKNFRGIKELEIDDFKQVNLFVGGNNFGKTSVLEALYCCTHPRNPFDFLFTNAARGLLTSGIKMGETADFNYNSLFYSMNTEIPIHLKYETDVYKTINFIIKPIFQTEISKSGIESSISGLESIGDQDGKEFRAKYPDENLPQKPLINRVFIYPNTWLTEQEYDNVTKADKKSEVISLLQKISPSILSFDALTKNFSILLKVEGFNTLIPLKAFGDGTNKLFNIACKLYGNYLIEGSVVFIDEIENGLHYTAQEKLWNWLFTIAKEKNIQIFATTHSEDCEKAFIQASKNFVSKKGADPDPSRLYRLEKKSDDTFGVAKYNYKDLDISINELEIETR